MKGILILFISLLMVSCASKTVYKSQGELVDFRGAGKCEDIKKIKQGQLKESSPNYSKKFDEESEFLTETVILSNKRKIDLATACNAKSKLITLRQTPMETASLLPYFREYKRQLVILKKYAKNPKEFEESVKRLNNMIAEFNNPKLVALECSSYHPAFFKDKFSKEVGLKYCLIHKHIPSSNRFDAYQILFGKQDKKDIVNIGFIGRHQKVNKN